MIQVLDITFICALKAVAFPDASVALVFKESGSDVSLPDFLAFLVVGCTTCCFVDQGTRLFLVSSAS